MAHLEVELIDTIEITITRDKYGEYKFCYSGGGDLPTGVMDEIVLGATKAKDLLNKTEKEKCNNG